MALTNAQIRKLSEAIATCTTREDLDLAFKMIKTQSDCVSRQATMSFVLGQKVKFDVGPRRGGVITGTVQKVNPKKIKVKTPTGVWNVDASLLEIV